MNYKPPAICLILLLFVSSCGVMVSPMVIKPSKEDQNKINQSWTKLLNPIDSTDRQSLLKELIKNQLYQSGVDSLSFRAVKSIDSGSVVMHIYYDQTKPSYDRFVIEIYDHSWNLVRRESYNREEVEMTAENISDSGVKIEPAKSTK